MTTGLLRPMAAAPPAQDAGTGPVRTLLVLLIVTVILLALWGMWRGWRHRALRQADLEEPLRQPPGGELTDPWLDGLPCRYLGTTSAGDWLDRIVAHGLGTPSRAVLSVGADGIWCRREGAADLFVPAADLRDVRVDRGIAGAVYEAGGVVVLTWALGDRLLDSGVRADRTDEHVAVVAAASRLLPAGADQPGPLGPQDGGTR